MSEIDSDVCKGDMPEIDTVTVLYLIGQCCTYSDTAVPSLTVMYSV